jgi:hypothetical protein
MSVAAAKRCEFDSSGKMLRQIREWIAALSAPRGNAGYTTLITGFSDPNL